MDPAPEATTAHRVLCSQCPVLWGQQGTSWVSIFPVSSPLLPGDQKGLSPLVLRAEHGSPCEQQCSGKETYWPGVWVPCNDQMQLRLPNFSTPWATSCQCGQCHWLAQNKLPWETQPVAVPFKSLDQAPLWLYGMAEPTE